MSHLSFEDLQVHELESSQTTTPPEEAHAALLSLPGPLSVTDDPGGPASHDARVTAWLHAAETAMQGPIGVTRGSRLMREASHVTAAAATSCDQPDAAPPVASRICTIMALFMTVVGAAIVYLALSLAGDGPTDPRLLTSHNTRLARDAEPDTCVLRAANSSSAVHGALVNLTHVMSTLADRLAHGILTGATVCGGAADMASFTMAHALCVTAMCVLAVCVVARLIVAPSAAAAAPRARGAAGQTTPRRASAAPGHRRSTPSPAQTALPRRSPMQAATPPPPQSPLVVKAMPKHDVGTQTPPLKHAAAVPQAPGVRRSTRILARSLMHAPME